MLASCRVTRWLSQSCQVIYGYSHHTSATTDITADQQHIAQYAAHHLLGCTRRVSATKIAPALPRSEIRRWHVRCDGEVSVVSVSGAIHSCPLRSATPIASLSPATRPPYNRHTGSWPDHRRGVCLVFFPPFCTCILCKVN